MKISDSEKAKIKLFKVIDRINEIKRIEPLGLSRELELELRNLEVKKMQLYSYWKD